MIEARSQTQLIHFLQDELAISSESIDIALRHQDLPFASLPMILWKYGLITLRQLERIFEWLEERSYSV